MTNITRHIHAVGIQTAKKLNIPYDILDNTTLNEKFDILPDAQLAEGTFPIAQYVAIGRGGHKNVTSAGGASVTTLHKHRTTNSALFEHLPFILREQDNDLSVEQRSRYGLRRLEVHGGVTYIAYYLRRLDHSNLEVSYNRNVLTSGERITTPYIPAAADLTPAPVVLSTTGVNITDGETISAGTLLSIDITAFEVAEIVAACVIIYGDETFATLSEIAMCSGLDTVTSAVNPGDVAFNYTEAIHVQLDTTFTARYELWLTSAGIPLSFTVGGSEQNSL